MASGIPARLTPREGRKFAFTVGAAFLALSGFMWWRDHETALKITLSLGVLLILAGIIVPGKLGPVYRGWMRFGELLSKVTTPIFMGAIFYVVLTPVGLVKRMVGGNSLIAKRDAKTFWADRPAGLRHGNLKRQF